mmetsp:Transcript_55648/g.108961  ORF Transcript_55648/g.108961 Transcript_55648/m.108961 type:complete len:116 (+) Transcript_55648:743-1090(+)
MCRVRKKRRKIEESWFHLRFLCVILEKSIRGCKTERESVRGNGKRSATGFVSFSFRSPLVRHGSRVGVNVCGNKTSERVRSRGGDQKRDTKQTELRIDLGEWIREESRSGEESVG